MNLFDDIQALNFIKNEEAEVIKKMINGNRIIDFLLYIPSYYKIYESSNFEIKEVKKGQEVNLNSCKIIKVENNSSGNDVKFSKYRKIPFIVKVQTLNLEEINLIFFQINDNYKFKFKLNTTIHMSGKIEDYKGKKSISHPKIQFEDKYFANKTHNEGEVSLNSSEVNQKLNKNLTNNIIKIIYPREDLNEDRDEKEDTLFFKNAKVKTTKDKINNDKITSIEGIYSLTEGCSNYSIKKNLKKIFSLLKQNDNYKTFLNFNLQHIPLYNNAPTFLESLERIHFPLFLEDINSDSLFFKRLAMDEILSNQISMNLIRKEEKTDGYSIKGNETLRNLVIKNLPFELTQDQQIALNDIYLDQQKQKRMFRLLQGDVGSGKTIVAILSALNTIEAGYKVAILSPTSILANQHFKSIIEISKITNISVELLTGNTSQKNRKNLNQMIRLGFVDIVVGTHALLYSDMDFSKFGLFIIDEQHSFGVEQREMLNKKNESADILMMSATPIPRTLLMSYYGDVEISIIKTKPKNRKTIDTKVMKIDNYDKILESIKNVINKNEKVYWVCPLIEESEKLDFQDAVSRYNDIASKISKDKIGLLHGGMIEAEKDRIMKDFLESKIKILVCTTVIEVGVNVPDATIIIIENANKFGLAQLHQLRGRVGRSDLQSYCILLYDIKISEKGKRRLEVLKESNDGFYIAEQDLKMRGGGNILGKQQSGFNIFKIATFFYDKEMIYKLSFLSKEIVKKIKNLEKSKLEKPNLEDLHLESSNLESSNLENSINRNVDYNNSLNEKDLQQIKNLKEIFCHFNIEKFINS